MNIYSGWHLIAGCCLLLLLSGGVQAADTDTAWNTWLVQQVKQHPDVVAAKEKMNAAFSSAEGRTRPLYNPELETEYEREGEGDNYRVGVNQTLDWWNRREVRTRQADFTRTAARQAYELAYQEKLTEALNALVEWHAAQERYRLATQQEAQLDALIRLVKERQKAGDLGAIDVELALLSLTQKLNETAQALADFKTVEAHLRELLPLWTAQHSNLPDTLWNVDTSGFSQTELENHPGVLAAKTEWEALQKEAELARLRAKAEPTVGVNAGREGEENVVGVTFSVPLHIRNNFSAAVKAARREALSAEARYRAVRRRQQFQAEAAGAVVEQYRKQVDRWQTLMRESREQSQALLEKQWRTGDLGTTDYLLALQQRMEGLVAGIELRERYRLAVLDWLLKSGRVRTHLTRPAR